MRVSVMQDKALNPDQLVLTCHKENEEVVRVKEYAEGMSQDVWITGKENGEMILIDPKDIYYIESVDKKTFIYLLEGCYEGMDRLYELEEKLKWNSFFRASKSTIVNIRHIERICMMVNRTLLLTMDNGEKLIVSRRNVKEFNQKIGME